MKLKEFKLLAQQSLSTTIADGNLQELKNFKKEKGRPGIWQMNSAVQNVF